MRYQVKTDTICDEEGNHCTVFGIEVVDADGLLLKSIPNIFADRDKAVRLVDLCNEKQLSLLHLMDVVEDALGEQYTVC